MAVGTFSLSNIQMRGRVGDLVFLPQENGRVIVRRVPTSMPGRTALQRESEGRMRRVGAAWQALTMAEGEAWARWAAGEGRRAYNAFLGLSAKRMQVFPAEAPPRLPPTSAFLGDGIVVEGGGSGAEGGIVFSASGPNSEGVLTELLAARLKSVHRTAGPKEYRTRGFVAFAAGSLEAVVPVEAGAWALAVRFVRAETGQETAVVPIGKVVVG